MRPIDADALIKEIKDLKESPWFNTGKERNSDAWLDVPHLNFLTRKEAVIMVVELCINEAPTLEPDRPNEKWECLKEHITEMRDADGKLNQKETCQFILNLMEVIEKEGEES